MPPHCDVAIDIVPIQYKAKVHNIEKHCAAVRENKKKLIFLIVNSANEKPASRFKPMPQRARKKEGFY